MKVCWTLISFLFLPTISLTAHPGEKATAKCEEYEKIVQNIGPGIVGSRRKRIVGGVETEPNSLPFVAALFYKRNSSEFYGCAGTLISPQFVLTASSCISLVPKTVQLGVHRFSSSDPEVLRISVEKVIKHPNKTKNSFQHDIALVKLQEEVYFTHNIQPACLNTGELPEYGRIAGWGVVDFNQDGGGVHSDVLKEAAVGIVPIHKCMEAYEASGTPQEFGHGQFCALGSQGEDACIGDSGGPYFTGGKDNRYPKVAGFASYGKDCGKYPGVYTNISHYIDWIEENVWPMI